MTVEAIKDAIAGLPEDERCSLALWLNATGYDAWDRKIVADFSSGGRGQTLLDRVRREIAEGRSVPLASGMAEARASMPLPPE